jgi:hypothetical protein
MRIHSGEKPSWRTICEFTLVKNLQWTVCKKRFALKFKWSPEGAYANSFWWNTLPMQSLWETICINQCVSVWNDLYKSGNILNYSRTRSEIHWIIFPDRLLTNLSVTRKRLVVNYTSYSIREILPFLFLSRTTNYFY